MMITMLASKLVAITTKNTSRAGSCVIVGRVMVRATMILMVALNARDVNPRGQVKKDINHTRASSKDS
jgi:hypothetical protein